MRPTAAGGLAAACTFVRPITYYWPIVVVAITAWRLRPRATRGCAVSRSPAVLPGALWTRRNAALTGYRGFSTTSATYFCQSRAAAIVADHANVTLEDARATLIAGAAAIDDDAARVQYMAREGRRIALEHPATFLRLYLTGIFRLLIGPAFAEYLQIYA